MKFVWIFFIFIVLCDKVKTRPSTESDVVNKTLTLKKGKSVISQTTQQHETLPLSHDSHIELTLKNRLMPKIQIKYTSVKNNNNSTFQPTTRRPLMRYRKFTSKPHAIYYIHTRTHGEQSNFSKRRNFNVKNQFKPQNNIKNMPNTSEDSSSVEDRFKNFTDVDNIGELVEPKGKVSINRPLKRRRGYLATAASEQSKSVALYTLKNTDKYRSKSTSAIHESLQKIKTIRPGMKRKSITAKTVPTKVNEYMKNYQIKDTQGNKIVSSENIVHGETITEKFVHLTTIADDNVLFLPITTEKSISSTLTTRNIKETLNKSESSIESTDKIEILSKTDSGIIKSLPLIIVTEKYISIPDMHKTVVTITNRRFVTTEETPISTTTKLDNTETVSEKIENSEAKTENSDNFASVIEKSVDTVVKIQRSDTLVTKTDIADHSTNLVAVDHSLAQTGKPIDLAHTTDKSDELTTKIQKSVDSPNKTETSENISIIITDNPADKIEFSENSDLEIVKSVPLIIVTDKSISLSNKNGTIIEAITKSNIAMPMETLNPKIRGIKENIITVSPISNEEEITITTEGDANHSAMRRKRRINIIEEERTATPSTGNSFSERETHIGADLTYRNIHT